MANATDKPALCEAEPPHALDWLTDEFAYCPGCDLLYVRQPGVLVWVHDVWMGRLADALIQARLEIELLRQGLTMKEADAWGEGIVEDVTA